MPQTFSDRRQAHTSVDQLGRVRVTQFGPAFRNVSGILSGRAVHAAADELGRLGEMFQDDHKGDHRGD